MNHPIRLRAGIGALTLCCAILPALSGCSLWNRVFHHQRNQDAGCFEKPFAQNTDNRPPLKVPEGLSAPDTRNAIKIPELTASERVRAKNEPCLSRPPSYFAQPLPMVLPPEPKPSKKRSKQPPAAPSPTAPQPTAPSPTSAPTIPDSSAPQTPPATTGSSK